nr:hypothetical protein [Tanacetum cinerariifolium]
MFTQLVVQGFAGHAERFSEAAYRTVRPGEFGGDQGAFEGFDLFAEAAARRRHVRVGGTFQLQLEAQRETLG